MIRKVTDTKLVQQFESKDHVGLYKMDKPVSTMPGASYHFNNRFALSR
jgi:hypothetical protein